MMGVYALVCGLASIPLIRSGFRGESSRYDGVLVMLGGVLAGFCIAAALIARFKGFQ